MKNNSKLMSIVVKTYIPYPSARIVFDGASGCGV